MEGYSEILLNDFLLNAGVVGLLRMFQYSEIESPGSCVNGTDYIIDGQRLYMRNEFLQTQDLGALFVGAMVHYLGPDTKFQRVLDQKTQLDRLYETPFPEDKAWKKSVDTLFKEFTDMLLKNSFKSGYVILSACSGVVPPTENMVLALRKEDLYPRKKELYDKLWNQLQQSKVQEILIFKDLLYSVVTMFYSDNKGNGAAFLSEREIEPSVAYNNKFVDPLRSALTEAPSKDSIACIGCGSRASRKLVAPITIFVDTADDLGKKKSYYWNCMPDAYLCPLCAFICSLAPLGFSYRGGDAIFINNNSDIETLMSFASFIAETKEEKPGVWFQLYNCFTAEKIKQLSHRVNNVQVIIREKRTESYRLNMIDKPAIAVFQECVKQFEFLERRFIKTGDDYINVHQQTVENVIHHRNQFDLLSKLIHVALSKEQSTGYLFNILLIQIAQEGGNNMEKSTKRAYIAKKQGEALRATLAKDLPEAAKDDKLRGLVYQMLNAVSLGNRDKFMELILRTYAGENIPVPDIFFSCFSGDEAFKEIGFAYLLGLKSTTTEYQKEEQK